ncbi:MAG: hypothetical protein ACSHW0_18780 [Thalassotalea sp.]
MWLQIVKKLNHVILLTVLLSCSSHAEKVDEILSLSSQTIIGIAEVPTVHVELHVNKTRDLHVALQDLSTMRPVKTTMKRIKKSGKYHFNVKIEELKPGNYRWNAYLTPKNKQWQDRIGKTLSQNIEVINAAKYVKEVEFSKQDRIKSVLWPKQINDNKEHLLTVKFDISQPRDLHIKLLSSENWQEFGALKYTVNQPKDIVMPFNNIIDSFEAGKYAWVVYLTDVGSEEPLVKKKFGKHFEVKSK